MDFYQGYEAIEYDGFPFRTALHKIGLSPLHWHEDIEILFVIDGEMKINIGNKESLLGPGEVILVNSNQIHNTSAVGESSAYIQILQFHPEYMKKYGIDLNEYIFSYSTIESKDEKLNSQLRSLLSRLLLEIYRKRDGYKLIAQSCLNEILCLFLRNNAVEHINYKMQKRMSNNCSQIRIQRLVDFVENHYTEKITLKRFAGREGVNENYLSRSFKSTMGCFFLSYLNTYRLQKSINLLINTEKNITEITEDSGFADIRTFIHVFKKNYGVPPALWRRRNISYLKESMDSFVETVQNSSLHHEFNLTLKDKESDKITGFACFVSDPEIVKSLLAPYFNS